MKGCRPLSVDEIQLVSDSFYGTYALRDRALFLLGIFSGFRISEMLSLRVQDVLQHGSLVSRVAVARRAMKGRRESRSVVLHPKAQEALRPWLEALETGGHLDPETFLFRSREGDNRAISRVQAHGILREAFEANQLQGKLATHSMRKSFANRAYEISGRDLLRTAKALGHKSVDSTISYLSFKQEEIDDLVLDM